MSASFKERHEALAVNTLWLKAEAGLKSFKRTLEEKDADRLSTLFYARWVAGYRCPKYLLRGLESSSFEEVTRFMEDSSNRFYVLEALNRYLRLAGYTTIDLRRPELVFEQLNELLGKDFIEGYQLKTFRSCPTKGQTKIIDRVAEAFGLKRQKVA